MITFKEYITEKLDVLNPNSESYKYLRFAYKHWDRERYKKLFDEYKSWGFLDKRSMRLYFPLSKKKTVTPPNNDVVSFVKDKGYEVLDYNRGILQKADSKGKLVTSSIQAVLSKYKQKDLESLYVKDPHHVDVKSNSSGTDDYLVVISRHPYDIIGMTSGRAWEDVSCMNLDTGLMSDIVPFDVIEGSLVAYLIKATDKDLQEPVGRLLLRPHLAPKHQVVLGVSTKGYYDNIDQTTKDLFHRRVIEWVDQIHDDQKLNGVFKLTPGLYKTEGIPDMVVGKLRKELDERDRIDLVSSDPLNLQTFDKEDITEGMLKAALKRSETIPRALEIFDRLKIKPSDEVLETAIWIATDSNNYQILLNNIFREIRKRFDVTDKFLIKAVQIDSDCLEPILMLWGNEVSDAFLIAAIKKSYRSLETILHDDIDLSDDVLLAAIKDSPFYLIDLIKAGKDIPRSVIKHIKSLNEKDMDRLKRTVDESHINIPEELKDVLG